LKNVGFGKTAAYEALSEGGRFSDLAGFCPGRDNRLGGSLTEN
jgi:hypothetical protein